MLDIQNVPDIHSLRGYEGSSSARYYKALSSLLQKDFQFQKRTRRPPADEANVLLSLGYTLLFNRVYGALNVVGLDPYQGMYHLADRGHATLASDFMEEFRVLIVDSVVLLLVNTREITVKDFSHSQGNIMLTHDGLKKALSRFEDKMNTVIMHTRISMRVSYQQCIEIQARQFARFIRGHDTAYMPFVLQ